MPDIPNLRLVGRLGLTVGDGSDPDTDPDVVWCSAGIVRFTPVNTYTKVAGGTPVPFSAGNAAIDVPIDSSGFLSWGGARNVPMLDLTSSAVNPAVAAGKATHTVQFRNVTADPGDGSKVPVAFPSSTIRIASDNTVALTDAQASAYGLASGAVAVDITKALPVPAAGGTPITVGQDGAGITALMVDGSTLKATLSNGDELSTDLPAPMVDSDAFVASQIEGDGTATKAALNAAYVAKPLTGMQRLIGQLQQRRGDVTVAVLGDSTADESPEWPTKGLRRIIASRPWLKFQRYAWADATASPWSDPTSGAYQAVAVDQTGTAPQIAGRVWYDTFDGTAGEIQGTSSTPTQAARTWGGATGIWARDGSGNLTGVTSPGSGINISTGITGATHAKISLDVTMDQTTELKRAQPWLGANASNRLALWVANDTGTWKWQLQQQVAGVGTTPLALAAIPGLATDGTLTKVTASLEINGTTATATVQGVSTSITLSSSDAAAIMASISVGLDSGYAIADGTGTKIGQFALDVFATREVPTLTLYNGAKAGSTLAYQRARLARVLPVAPDVVLIGSSHNYVGIDAADYLADVQETIEQVHTLWPDAFIVISSQNPELPPHSASDMDTHRDRCLALPQYAAENGFGYIAAFEAFTADGPQPQRIRSDGTHPTGDNAAYDNAPDPTGGSYLWSQAFLDYLAAEGMTPIPSGS